MKVANKRWLPIIAAVVLVVTLAWQFWPQPLTIDNTWLIVYNSNDQYDSATAQFLQTKFGAILTPISQADDLDLNRQGQNLLFIGGGETFSGKLPWFETWFLQVVQPDEQPDVYFDVSVSPYVLHTPKGNYDPSIDDLGAITRAYDNTLKRWIIISVGWSAECTASGAKILIENLDLVRSKSWLVYKYTGNQIALEDWELSQFTYQIVDSG